MKPCRNDKPRISDPYEEDDGRDYYDDRSNARYSSGARRGTRGEFRDNRDGRMGKTRGGREQPPSTFSRSGKEQKQYVVKNATA